MSKCQCHKRRSLRSHVKRISKQLDCVTDQLDRVTDKLRKMEVNFMVTQEMLDALVARIDTAVTNIRQDIQDVKDAHPDLDLSSLEASVAGLEGLDGENPAPAVEPTE